MPVPGVEEEVGEPLWVSNGRVELKLCKQLLIGRIVSPYSKC